MNPTPANPALLTDSLTIAIQTFRPLGGVFPITATFVPSPNVVQEYPMAVDGTNILVSPPAGARVQLEFRLFDPKHILLGVAFATNSDVAPAGQSTFPEVEIRRMVGPEGLPGGSRMLIIDDPQGLRPHIFNYVILVQSVVTAEIGIIDPRIINDPRP
jgi:hypothetical protein